MQLPHWTDPPTGEVPRLGGESADDDYETWSSFTGPGTRFRTDSSDWNAGDFAHGELAHDDNTMVGALSDHDEHEEAWGPPGRRGRGRRGRPGPQPEGPGGSLEGPAGYEPVDTGDDHDPADLNRRLVTGAVMAVVALAAFVAGSSVAVFLVTIVVGIGAFELFDAFRRAGYHTAVPVGLLGCIAIVPIAYKQGAAAFPLVVLVITFSMLWYLFEVVHQRPTVNIALTMLVFGYVGVLGGFAGLLLAPKPGRHRPARRGRDLRHRLRHRGLLRRPQLREHPADAPHLPPQDSRRPHRRRDRGHHPRSRGWRGAAPLGQLRSRGRPGPRVHRRGDRPDR